MPQLLHINIFTFYFEFIVTSKPFSLCYLIILRFDDSLNLARRLELDCRFVCLFVGASEFI